MNYAYYITLNAKMQLAFSRFFKKTREFSRFSPFVQKICNFAFVDAVLAKECSVLAGGKAETMHVFANRRDTMFTGSEWKGRRIVCSGKGGGRMSKKKWEMKQHSGSSAGVGKALGIGLGAGVVLTVALAAVFAALMDRQLLQESATGILAMAILVISAAIGAWCSAKLAAGSL